jgi:hypothetical protein
MSSPAMYQVFNVDWSVAKEAEEQQRAPLTAASQSLIFSGLADHPDRYHAIVSDSGEGTFSPCRDAAHPTMELPGSVRQPNFSPPRQG